jgi:hypothetical protein
VRSGVGVTGRSSVFEASKRLSERLGGEAATVVEAAGGGGVGAAASRGDGGGGGGKAVSVVE